MDAETYTDLIPIIFLGVVFFIVAISALYSVSYTHLRAHET